MMGGMIAVMVLAPLMVPVLFVSVQRFFAGDRETANETAAEPYGSPAPVQYPVIAGRRQACPPSRPYSR